ncbi:MAG: hypothetical protein A2Y10_14805 [Planctomycetes bacterium GWF2_41_51]|nr:MAG: hypothetical protein A2Y10_14805 [Planctomycetes bacterium GWF2_41_51]HBG28987.1 hypothetical protein [Phycisphaerales bacterium]
MDSTTINYRQLNDFLKKKMVHENSENVATFPEHPEQDNAGTTPLVPSKSAQFEFKPETHEIINEHLKDHQVAIEWEKKELIQNLHIWRERFIFEFNLKIDGLPAISIDRIRKSAYGLFKLGRNGFGLRNEITINEVYIDNRAYWQIIGTFLHELLHAEQEQSGKPYKTKRKNKDYRYTYHNKDYRDRAASFGLIVDQWGHQRYVPPPSPFWDILYKYGISITDIDKESDSIAPLATAPGNSKLKLWICGCQPKPVHVRVAIEDFQAKCLKCGTIFRRA